jgi:ribosomal protein L14E/L6E/L27E
VDLLFYSGLHRQVLIDGPSEKAPVPRQEVALAKLSLLPIVIPKLPRATGVGHVAKKWQEAKVDQQFNDSAWAKKRASMQKRRGLNDFERFKVMKMRKQVRRAPRRVRCGHTHTALRAPRTWLTTYRPATRSRRHLLRSAQAPRHKSSSPVGRYGVVVAACRGRRGMMCIFVSIPRRPKAFKTSSLDSGV